MHATLLVQQFELHHHVAHVNLAGITHEEALFTRARPENCLNWVPGHVVATRNIVMVYGSTTRALTRSVPRRVDHLCRRWREWQPQDTMDAAGARPVLGFRFRTCHLEDVRLLFSERRQECASPAAKMARITSQWTRSTSWRISHHGQRKRAGRRRHVG
jgi:hypothetical protein